MDKLENLKEINDLSNCFYKNKKSIALDDLKYRLNNNKGFLLSKHPVFGHIKKLFDEHTIFITPSEKFFRARIVNDNDFNKFFKDGYLEGEFYGYNKKDSFVPRRLEMNENRANYRGIPCLYTAKEEETAISEIRPFIGNKVSVATLQAKGNLKLFDLSIDLNLIYTYTKPPYSEFWLSLAVEYFIPYMRNSNKEYLLTQCISEYIQLSGFDGIQYSSSLNEGGINIALFNCLHEDDGGEYDICEPIESHTYTIKNIKHCFEYIS